MKEATYKEARAMWNKIQDFILRVSEESESEMDEDKSTDHYFKVQSNLNKLEELFWDSL